ncbi:TRAP transporter small permease [Orrella sp. 11846]|uniref:TRAP transporter small permease n=1 Tax=Orrella sp. 11846 TaxID=3409913 RepID=UPI003B5A9E0B
MLGRLSFIHAMLRRLNTAITLLVKWVVVVLALGMAFCILFQIIMRYVFNNPPVWTEELALLLFSWSMLLMLAVGVREAFHVRMDLFLAWLPKTGSQVIERIIDFAIAAFGGFLAWSGAEYMEMMAGSTSAAIAYPINVLYAVAPVCGVMVFLFSLELLLDPKRFERQEDAS